MQGDPCLDELWRLGAGSCGRARAQQTVGSHAIDARKGSRAGTRWRIPTEPAQFYLPPQQTTYVEQFGIVTGLLSSILHSWSEVWARVQVIRTIPRIRKQPDVSLSEEEECEHRTSCCAPALPNSHLKWSAQGTSCGEAKPTSLYSRTGCTTGRWHATSCRTGGWSAHLLLFEKQSGSAGQMGYTSIPQVHLNACGC